MRFNDFTYQITMQEGKHQSLSIAQVNEVVRLTFILLMQLDEKERNQLLKRYENKKV